MTDQKVKRLTREGVIKAYQEGLSIKEIIERSPFHRATVYRWLQIYRRSGRTTRLPMKPSATKQRYLGKVMELYKAGMSYEEIHRRIPAVTPMSARRWIIASGIERSRRDVAMKAKEQKAEAKKSKDNYSEEDLKQMSQDQMIKEFLRIQANLKDEKTLRMLSEMMINVAEKQLGVSIRKKPGAK